MLDKSKMRKIYRILVRRCMDDRELVRPQDTRVDNIKMDINRGLRVGMGSSG
jgi:hypothetical protein